MKKILIITQHVPTPTSQHGVFKRLGTFLEAINENYVIDFLFYIWPNQSFDHDELRVLIEKIWGVNANLILTCPIQVKHAGDDLWNDYLLPAINIFENPNYFKVSGEQQVKVIENYVNSELPDALFAHRLSSMCPLIKCKARLPTVYFDLDDIEHVVLLRRIKNSLNRLKNLLLYLQLPVLMLFEKRSIKLSKNSFVCSNLDADYLSNKFKLATLRSIPNAVTIPDNFSIPGKEKSILFIGSYNYKPNVDAADILISKIWPIILNSVPDSKLYIAGGSQDLIPSFGSERQNVVYTGFVEDLDALYANVQIICCPIFTAGGTRVKIIEAAAYGKAIVSTEVGAEGLDLIDEKDIIIRNNIDEIAEACIRLLNSTHQVKQLGVSARKVIGGCYDKAEVVKLIKSIVN
jgi:glycosyltransferase involved in cell wall biosynthesis